MRRLLTISVAAAAGLGLIAALGLAAGPQGGGPPELRPVHVQGKTIAPGVKMTVHVFYGKKNGPPGRPAPTGDACRRRRSRPHPRASATPQTGGWFHD